LHRQQAIGAAERWMTRADRGAGRPAGRLGCRVVVGIAVVLGAPVVVGMAILVGVLVAVAVAVAVAIAVRARAAAGARPRGVGSRRLGARSAVPVRPARAAIGGAGPGT